MTVQDITRLIVLPAAYTESKKGAVLKPHPFYKLSGRMIDSVYATAVFIDSADNQLPFQSVLLGKKYREKEIRERRPGAALVGGRYLADSADRPCDTWDRDVIHFGNRPVDFLLDVTQTMLVFQYKKDGPPQIVKAFVSP